MMREIKAGNAVTKEELVVLDLPDDYIPVIGQLINTTTGVHKVDRFVDVDLSPVLSVGENRSTKKVLLLSLKPTV